jgi:peptidoglycan/xylan/chitin deacetylase (PgdA/CDA1 family)
VATLASSPYVEIGAHTVNHPVLAGLAPGTQRREIEESRDVLQQLADSPVDSFAYPYGSPADYSSATVRLLKESQLLRACTTTPAPVGPRTDPLRTPRFLVRDWDAVELDRKLAPLVGK